MTTTAAASAERAATGYNYVVLQFAFGTLTVAQVLRAIALFAGEVMPAMLDAAA